MSPGLSRSAVHERIRRLEAKDLSLQPGPQMDELLAFVKMQSKQISAPEMTIHAASSRLSATSGFQLPAKNGASAPTMAAATKAQRSVRAISAKLACFQRAKGATPIRKSAGIIKGANTESK